MPMLPYTIGFSGTRKGMSGAQLRALDTIIPAIHPTTVIHGGAVGADTQFHNWILKWREIKQQSASAMTPDFKAQRMAPVLTITRCRMTVYPPTQKQELHWHGLSELGSLFRVAAHADGDYLARNKVIVHLCDCLLACPDTQREYIRSGTWATVRYARRDGKRIVIVLPDGKVKAEPPRIAQSHQYQGP